MPGLITSLQNPRVKQAVKLRERRQRDREGLLLVEGADEIALALAGNARPQTLFYCPGLSAQPVDDILAAAVQTGAELIEVSLPVFQ